MRSRKDGVPLASGVIPFARRDVVVKGYHATIVIVPANATKLTTILVNLQNRVTSVGSYGYSLVTACVPRQLHLGQDMVRGWVLGPQQFGGAESIHQQRLATFSLSATFGRFRGGVRQQVE